jgi:hypothetical protein
VLVSAEKRYVVGKDIQMVPLAIDNPFIQLL